MGMGTKLRDALRAAGLRHSKELRPKTDSPCPASTNVQGGMFAELLDRVTEASERDKAVRQNGPEHFATSATDVLQNVPRGSQDVAHSGPHSLLNSQCKEQPADKAVPAEADCPRGGLIRSGMFRPNDLFLPDPLENAPLPYLAFNGIAASLTSEPQNETDLVVGLDFGTSTTKVVIRDVYAATSVFPVRLSGQRAGIEGFLLPSRVFRKGNAYSLLHGPDRISDLKLALLECPAASPVTEFNDCCAFLALVIRRARAWLLTEHRDIYSRHVLNWRLNLGLPARSYEDEAIVRLFRRLAWAAANLAGDAAAEEITVEKADEWRLRSHEIARGRDLDASPSASLSWADVDVVPEVSAQLQGFMTAARWDWRSRPVMMLVDVGAGTVDSAMFHVSVPADGHGVLTFYSSRVEQSGVMNLHRQRVRSLNALLPTDGKHDDARAYLHSIEQPTDRLRPIPASVDEYLLGYRLVSTTIDGIFRRTRYRKQVAGCISDAKVGKGIPSAQLAGIPLLLCGGGARMAFYSSIDDEINGTSGWRVSVEVVRLPVPTDLADTGWYAEDFDRLSVAYGLSSSGDGQRSLGAIVRAIDVPHVNPFRRQEYDDLYVSKDQV